MWFRVLVLWVGLAAAIPTVKVSSKIFGSKKSSERYQAPPVPIPAGGGQFISGKVEVKNFLPKSLPPEVKTHLPESSEPTSEPSHPIPPSNSAIEALQNPPPPEVVTAPEVNTPPVVSDTAAPVSDTPTKTSADTISSKKESTESTAPTSNGTPSESSKTTPATEKPTHTDTTAKESPKKAVSVVEKEKTASFSNELPPLTATPKKSVYNKFETQVCVGIPSARRYKTDGGDAPEHYLSPLLNKLFEGIEPSDLLVYVWNVDRVKSMNTEPQKLTSRFPIQVLDSNFEHDQIEKNLPGMVMDSFEMVPVTKAKQAWRAKEVLDNAMILEKCKESGRPYTLFLEDDVLPTSHVWKKMEDFVRTVPDKYAFLTLYNPSVWEEEDKVINNGDEYNFFCCTQSLLFDNSRIEPVIEKLREGYAREPVDHLLVEYLHNSTSKVYVSVPSMFQHMGAYSTLAERTADPPEVAHQSLSWEALLQPSRVVSLPEFDTTRKNHEQDSCETCHFSTSFVA
eukprot:c8160_g1_i3.p1 GENE.c8160_g1_i3~~c8160_g1_i3.p1  ORF type:complete len:510 (+),score=140.44 c8160_g1_i3:23-1552(+)